MNKIKLIGSAAVLALGCAVSSQAQVDLQFASSGAGLVTFSGGKFSFGPGGAAPQFTIGSSTLGLENGDTGYITGSYTIGTINVAGNEAPVTGSGLFVINDGHGQNLVGTVSWVDLATIGTKGAIINMNGVLNLTGITYSGTQAGLLALALDGAASDSIDFTFTSNETLAKLKSGSPVIHSTFSGSVSAAVPEPTTMLAGVLLALPFGASTLRILRKNRKA